MEIDNHGDLCDYSPLNNQPISMKHKLFDSSIIQEPQAMLDFITNILESSTEYSIIAKDLNGNIILWNEGARRIYGYAPEVESFE